MPEFSNYVEGLTPAASADGSEIIPVSKDGDAVSLTSQQIADLGGGGGTSIPYGTTSGTNTYTITATPTVTAYADGLFLIKIGTSSTNASTLNFDSVGALKVYERPNKQITAGDFEAGMHYLVQHDSALDGGTGGFIVVGDLNHERLTYRGGYDVSSNLFPSTGGSGPSGGLRTGDFWAAANTGTLGSTAVSNRDLIINIGGSSPGQTEGNWAIISGVASVDTKLRKTRTVTGTDSIVQSDDNSLIIFNSATAFNFTLDQLTTGSKVQFMNINTGVVTFVNGTGVTVAPTGVTLLGAGSGVYPGAFVFYTSATTPIVSSAYPESWLDWTPTFTGYSANPTGVTARYSLVGKTCTARLHMTPGTSNDTGQSVTLPFTSKGRNSYSIIVTNNGITQFGRCDTLGSSNILTLYSSAAGGAFTNSGGKGCYFVLTYEIE
jgi:hypothetical protein